MYPGVYATTKADQPAIIMASSGETITYRELEARENRLAHLFRARGMKRLDHYAVFMENNARYVECCGVGERSGYYFTCVNSFLTPEELAYIVNNCEAKILITSQAKRDVALAALKDCPKVELTLIVDGPGDGDKVLNLEEATKGFPSTPIADQYLGTAMLYSSGTTGRPKGILRPLPEQPPEERLPLFEFLDKLWRYREGMIYLSPAPLYHSAPQAAVNLAISKGEFLTMLGPSGSGKTTCLMMLAGFETATHGEIKLNGRPINNIPPHKRGIGMVFQNYALFPHMNVSDNIEYPLKLHHWDAGARKARVKEILDLIELPHAGGHSVGQLSGGQRQRSRMISSVRQDIH